MRKTGSYRRWRDSSLLRSLFKGKKREERESKGSERMKKRKRKNAFSLLVLSVKHDAHRLEIREAVFSISFLIK
jgi:hypothetical protein